MADDEMKSADDEPVTFTKLMIKKKEMQDTTLVLAKVLDKEPVTCFFLKN